ncbi:MAG TPA: MTH1187 family thiamine-binding protein [bacterium]|nr:MTH1187 family thiamine-binding protein [bacterium]
MAILAISVTPIGTGTPSVGAYVADALRVIEQSGLRYRLNAMHTEVEGELEEVLRLIPAIHHACFARGAKRVSTVIKIDDRRDAPSSIEGKVRSVEARLRPAG